MKKIKIFSKYISNLESSGVDASFAAKELTERTNNWVNTKKNEISVEDIVVYAQACGTKNFAHFFLTATVKYTEQP